VDPLDLHHARGRQPLKWDLSLVAGAGFEPATFGL
jgi:hypothetical protein